MSNVTKLVTQLVQVEDSIRSLTQRYIQTGYAHLLVQLEVLREDKSVIVSQMRRCRESMT